MEGKVAEVIELGLGLAAVESTLLALERDVALLHRIHVDLHGVVTIHKRVLRHYRTDKKSE